MVCVVFMGLTLIRTEIHTQCNAYIFRIGRKVVMSKKDFFKNYFGLKFKNKL